MIASRRGFLGGLLASAVAAPAVIRLPGLLMPVKAAPRLKTQILVVYRLPDNYKRHLYFNGESYMDIDPSNRREVAVGPGFGPIPDGWVEVGTATF